MQRPLEIILGGPATVRPLMELLKEACTSLGNEITSDQEDAFRALLVDAAAGRVYLPRYKGQDVGFVFVSFQHSVLEGGRIAVIDDFYLSAKWQGLGLARRILRAVHQDLESFGIPLISATLLDGSPLLPVFEEEGFNAQRCVVFKKTLWGEEDGNDCTF